MTRCHALAQSVQVVDSGHPDGGAVLLMLLHPEDRSGLDQAQAYIAGMSIGEAAAFSTWDVFLRAAGSARAMEEELERDLELRYVDMSSSESARRDLGLTASTRSGRTDGADIA